MATKEQLSEVVRVRISAREYKQIMAKAQELGRSVSDYIRRVLIGKEKP
jgi:hypothetical protein